MGHLLQKQGEAFRGVRYHAPQQCFMFFSLPEVSFPGFPSHLKKTVVIAQIPCEYDQMHVTNKYDTNQT